MLSYTEVTGADPAALTALSKAWRGVADTHTDAAGRLNTQAVEKLWGGTLEGHSIRAAHGRGGELHTQVKAGATEADDLAAYMQDFAGTVRGLQAELATLVSQAGHAGMDVSSAGVVSVPAATLEVLRDSGHMDLQGTALQSAEEFNTRIRQVLKRATEADAGFKRNLRLVAELDRDGDVDFNADGRHDIEVTEQARRAADLLRGGGDGKVSAGEVARANELLAKHGGDDVFATALMKELGPEGMLKHAGEVSYRLGSDDDPGNDGLVRDLQERLGTTLATATDPGNEAHLDKSWTDRLMEAGISDITVGDPHDWENQRTTPGYTLLGPLLRTGEYDADFINPVTRHMLALDQAGMDWTAKQPGPDPILGHDPVANNPLNGALVALDRNPEAATELLSQTGDTDGYPAPKSIDIDQSGVDGVDDPLRYLLEKANDPGEYPSAINGDVAGDAIEAAATGLSSDSDPSASHRLPTITADMADIAQRTMEYAVDQPDQFVGLDSTKSDMVDNFGGIAARYIEDFHLDKQGKLEILTADPDNAHLSLDVDSDGTKRDLGDEWLKLIGHDEVGSATVWSASEKLMEAEMQAVVAKGGVEKALDFDQVFEMHGGTTGLLTTGGLEGIREDSFNAAEDRNAVLDGVKKGASIGTGVLVGSTGWGLGASTAAGEGANFVLDQGFGWWQDTDEEIWERVEEDQRAFETEIDKAHISGPMLERVIQYVEAAAPHMTPVQVEETAKEFITDYKAAVRPASH